MYMSFEFNCRTRDNVELTLEGSFFWEIIDLPAMNRATSDTTGDLCNHARSKFIEKVAETLFTAHSHYTTTTPHTHTIRPHSHYTTVLVDLALAKIVIDGC